VSECIKHGSSKSPKKVVKEAGEGEDQPSEMMGGTKMVGSEWRDIKELGVNAIDPADSPGM
jgi:hypothetical protein